MIAGLDEAGRGPLAGPVVAAAVILDPGMAFAGIDDSKALDPKNAASACRSAKPASPGRRLGRRGRDRCLNILQATFLAMRRALLPERVPRMSESTVIDCPTLPALAWSAPGPSSVAMHSEKCIGAASILAKTCAIPYGSRLDALSRIPILGHKGYDHASQGVAGAARTLADCIDRRLPLSVSLLSRDPRHDVSFVHLRLHTEYSLVDSVVRIPRRRGSCGLMDARGGHAGRRR